MSDRELLNNLNETCKKYIDDFLSFYTTLYEVKDEKKYSVDYVFSTALLLSTLKNDNISSRFFNKYGINYDNFLRKTDVKELDIVKFTKAENSKYLPDINLKSLINKTIVKTKYTCYIENENLSINKLQMFQLFDAFIDYYSEFYGVILKVLYDLNTREIFNDYDEFIQDYYSDFAFLHYNVDINEEARKEETDYKLYDFDNVKIELIKNDAFVTFKKDADLNKIIWHVKKEHKKYDKVSNNKKGELISSIELPITYKINKIDTKKEINKDAIESVLLNTKKSSKVPIEIVDLNNNETNLIWLNKYEAFTSENNKIVDSIMNRRMEDEEPLLPEPILEDDKDETPYLDKYGFDLTRNNYLKDPCVGRDDEIKRMEQILCYPERDKSIIVTGISGSGKTALVKGLAYRIQKGKVPKVLKNMRIISIDAASLVSGCKYVGMLEERMKDILEEASKSKDIILFMDEVHQALGAGKSEGDPTSVAEILKPYLDYGRVRLIGATTTEEYNDFVSRDDAFKTRFKRIDIKEPDDYIVYLVLEDLIHSYNKLSESNICPKLDLDDEQIKMVIDWLIESTQPRFRTYNDRASNPRLVLDIIKEAYAIASINDKNAVDLNDIKEALLLEARLYDSSKKRQIEKLDQLKPIKKEDNVIQFSLIKKK